MAETLTMASKVLPVAIDKMRVSSNAQRDLNAGRVAYLAENFNPEEMGYPVVNARDGFYFIIDGQHRIESLKLWLGGDSWKAQKVDCRVYSGLTEKQEADMFDRLNDALTPTAFAKFRIRVTAGRTTECHVARCVAAAGLKISQSQEEGCVSCVNTLIRVFKRSKKEGLLRTLDLTYKSFGTPGLTARVIDGVSLVCDRYNGQLDDVAAVERLSTLNGGIGRVLSSSEQIKARYGRTIAQCVAAAIVDILNAKRGGKKLPNWWAE